jgi:hypothetical protein
MAELESHSVDSLGTWPWFIALRMEKPAEIPGKLHVCHFTENL